MATKLMSRFSRSRLEIIIAFLLVGCILDLYISPFIEGANNSIMPNTLLLYGSPPSRKHV